MLITADQLIAHAVGDYILQSDWMANTKTQKSSAALAHVLTYFLPFLFLTTSWKALAVIIGTHFVIDRWRLARYVCWAKNFLAPKWIVPIVPLAQPLSGGSIKLNAGRAGVSEDDSEDNEQTTIAKVSKPIRNHPWSECSGTGYYKERPPFLAVWLLIAADNIMHVIINGLALKYLG